MKSLKQIIPISLTLIALGTGFAKNIDKYINLKQEDPVFYIEEGNKTSIGTAFCFYSDDNYSLLLTTAHITETSQSKLSDYYLFLDSKLKHIKKRRTNPELLEILVSDASKDIAVVKTSVSNLPYFEFGNIKKLRGSKIGRKGTILYIQGYTYYGADNITETYLVKRKKKPTNYKKGSSIKAETKNNLLIFGSGMSGLSGAPLLTKEGKVVGMIRAGYTGYIGYAISSKDLMKFLEKERLPYFKNE